ncbi:putative nuclease HARBI1 [Epinephelus fuscoguttatus]|uniref:putative nuclease HARBI1 n=1 Tax=Epinephelus fuscoguttatus TaxID=293821 RepID=UPI0020D056D6|nr:putative nuclease HARBI1 [Epinephelus fuscoguttatus]
MTIIDLVARWPGSTHDARILRESALYQDFEAGRVTGLLLGDSGYPLKRWLMTPLIAPRTAQEHNYNMKHASTRNIVERCIGVLKRRFHCLHGEMRMHPERVCVVIAAAAVLHNICIKKRIPLPRQEDVVPEVDENPAPAIPEDISGRLARNHIINNL